MTTPAKRITSAGAALAAAGALLVPLGSPMAAAAPPTPLQSAQALATGVAGSAVNLATGTVGAPVWLAKAGYAATQNDATHTADALNEIVSGPLWAADPLILGLDDALPAPFGQGVLPKDQGPLDSTIMAFRTQQLWPVSDGAQKAVSGAVALPVGLIASGTRLVTGTVTSPLNLIPLGQAVLTQDKDLAYQAIRQYTDAPLWIADPTLQGLNEVLPAPLGGGEWKPTQGLHDSEINSLRTDVLWKATDDVRTGIAGALDVDPNQELDTSSAFDLSPLSAAPDPVIESVTAGSEPEEHTTREATVESTSGAQPSDE